MIIRQDLMYSILRDWIGNALRKVMNLQKIQSQTRGGPCCIKGVSGQEDNPSS
jgi:hypothetical protein